MTLVFGSAFVVTWVISSIVAYGYTFAFWQKEFPLRAKDNYWEDVRDSLICSLWGPIALVAMKQHHLNLYRHGWRLW